MASKSLVPGCRDREILVLQSGDRVLNFPIGIYISREVREKLPSQVKRNIVGIWKVKQQSFHPGGVIIKNGEGLLRIPAKINFQYMNVEDRFKVKTEWKAMLTDKISENANR